MKKLAKLGVNRARNQAKPISEEDEERLWLEGLLGNSSPEVLLNTIVYLFGVHFAMRAVQEHKDLKANSQVQVLFDEKLKLKYLLYTENSSKNNQ